MPRLLPDFRGLPRPFWVLFAGTLVNRVGGFVLVFLAIYLTEVRGLSAAQAGAVMSVYGLGAIAGGPLGGALSDRVGRRLTLGASLIGGGASMMVLGLMTGTPAITAAAAVTGLLYEMYRPVVNATIADVVHPDDRPRAYGLVYWAINLGASAAPVLGGLIAARSYRLLFAADGLTTLLYGVIVWMLLPETRPVSAPSGPGWGGVRAILNDTVYLWTCLLAFALSLVFFQSFVGLAIDVRAHGVSAAGFGGLMAINGLLIVGLQPFAGELIQRDSRTLALAAASLLIGVGFGMNAWVGSPAGYAASVAIWTLGEILFSPASISLVSDLAPPHLRGAYQGGFSLAFTSAFAAAPLAGGYLIAGAGAPVLWVACLVTGIATGIGFLVLGRGAAGRQPRTEASGPPSANGT
jgi:MFS family permease